MGVYSLYTINLLINKFPKGLFIKKNQSNVKIIINFKNTVIHNMDLSYYNKYFYSNDKFPKNFRLRKMKIAKKEVEC